MPALRQEMRQAALPCVGHMCRAENRYALGADGPAMTGTGYALMAEHFEGRFKDWNQDAIVSVIVTWLIIGLCMWIAAKLMREQEGYLTALLASLVATVVYVLIQMLLPNVLGLIIAIIVAAAIISAFYKTRWIKGLIIGILAILIATLVQWLLGMML